MNVHAGRARSGLSRVLTVVALLAGVLAMHGLTGHHDPAMAMPHGSGDQATVEVTDQNAHKAHKSPEHHAALIPVTDRHAAREAAPPHDEPIIGAGEAGHGMAAACLAILTALALAVALLLALRCLRASHPVQVTAPAARTNLPGRSPPWLRPSLSKLCVLRT